jgi:CubicO group peptidase (beta-lactamase class C family)
MMKCFFVIPIFLIVAYVQTLQAQVTGKIHSLFSAYDSLDSPGCAVLVMKDERIIFTHGYGSANLEHRAPITSKTVFYIGSISKQFTALCAALLEEEGKLSLDDDIRKYIPELPEYEHTIHVRDLIYHTNGLQQYFELWENNGRHLEDILSAEDVLQLLIENPTLLFQPGEKYSYSNSGYFLLAQIVERVSGMSFADYATQHIFIPLDMNDSHFHTDRYHVIPNRAMSYFKRDDGSFGVYMLNYEIAGPGGLYTTVEDLAKWDSNFYHNKLGYGTQSLIDRTLVPGRLNDDTTLDYAFGLRLEEFQVMKTVEHGGSLAGYRAYLMRIPEIKTSVIILGNLAEMTTEKLGKMVMDEITR